MAEISFEALRCCQLFYGISDELLEQLVPAFEEIVCPEGELLFAEGDEGDAFYLVVGGVVRLRRQARASVYLTVADLGPGEVFGEMSLITSAPRTTDCVALENSRLWKLSRSAYEGLQVSGLPAYSAVLKNLTALLCQRLSGATAKVAGLIEQLSEAETQKSDLKKRVEMNRSGLVNFLASLGK